MLPPLLHMLYRYGTCVLPHGENAILVHRDGVPTRLAIKDFVDDVDVAPTSRCPSCGPPWPPTWPRCC